MKRSLALGVLLIVAGFVGVAVPGFTAWVPAVQSLPLLAAAAATVAGVGALRGRLRADRKQCQPAPRESYREAPTPGAEFDELLGAISSLRFRNDDRRRNRVRTRLERVAVDVLIREGYSESEARTLLKRGGWTDDPVAAALFAADPPSPTLNERVDALVDRTPTFTLRARRVVDVLAARTGTEGSG